MTRELSNIFALCVGRHPMLSDHYARYFQAIGFSTRAATGLADAVTAASNRAPDIVICDYELLATLSLNCWENDALLSRTAVIAVSLSRRPDEAHLLDVNGIAGFLYLPTLQREMAQRILTAASPSSCSSGNASAAAALPLGHSNRSRSQILE
ncbi:MAG: hypothetical protein WKF55_04465 [Gemmatimonadaceae bacterium]